jgi:NAD(P)H-hydrate epimerase
VLVLKGASTVVAAPDGRVFVNPTGNSGLAKGGTGDVLTGLIVGLMAQGKSLLDAACAGVSEPAAQPGGGQMGNVV